MKIVMFGNTNNYPFLLAQGFRSHGVEVKLIINRKEVLHRPESVHPEFFTKYPDWIVDCSHVTDIDYIYDSPFVNDVLKHFEGEVSLFVLNDVGPSLSNYIKAPHVVLLTGSDLTYWANEDLAGIRSLCWSDKFKRSIRGKREIRKTNELVARQRFGIQSANYVLSSPVGLIKSWDNIFESIGVKDHRRLFFWLANANREPFNVPTSSSPLRILGGSRINFSESNRPAFSATDYKGTDTLIRGFSKFIKRSGSGVLLLPLKGEDINLAKELIATLHIEDFVEWYPEIPLIEFHQLFESVHVIADQFGDSPPSILTVEAMTLGRPVLANLMPEFYKPIFGTDIPGLHAVSDEDVCERLFQVHTDRKLLFALSTKSRAFIEEFCDVSKVTKKLMQNLFEIT